MMQMSVCSSHEIMASEDYKLVTWTTFLIILWCLLDTVTSYKPLSLYGYEWTFSTQLTQTKVKQVLIYKKVSYDKNFIPLHNIGSAVCTCVFTWNKWPPKKPSYRDWRQKISWHRLHTPSSRTLSPHAKKLSLTSFGMAWLAFFQTVSILSLHDHALNMLIHAVA